MATWDELIVPLREVDAARLLGFWSWIIDRPVVPIELTRFGDWFLIDDAGAVHRLGILEGAFAKVCATVDEYHSRRDLLEERDEWFSEGMVEALLASGVRPGPGQGFGYRAPPILGASLERENIVIVDLAPWQIFMSMLHEAISRLPAGTAIERLEILADGRLKLHTVRPRP